MDYSKKYKELISAWNCVEDVSNLFPDCNDFEKCVIALRKAAWTYGDIQKILGMPSKKTIRSVLLRWSPELIDNSPKKVIEVSQWESDLYNILCHTTQQEFESDYEYIKLWIEDHKIKYEDEFGYIGDFHSLDDRSKHAYLLLVKNIINEKSINGV